MKMPIAPASWMLCCAAALLLSAATARAEEAVVVASTVPGQSPGTVIADGQPLALPDGSSATLLFRSGQMLKLHGPFNGRLPTADTGGSGALAGALRMQGVDVSVVGGSREMAPSARRAMDGDDIRIDPQRSATYCIGPHDTLWLRRPSFGADLGIRRNASLRTVAWPEGVAQITWPDDLMIADGDRFAFVDAAGREHGRIIVRRLDTAPRSETAWVAQMLVMGCADQARPALREIAHRSVAPEIYLASDLGRHPVYRAGAPVRLVVQSNLDGQLYCFARTARNGTLPIFPGAARGGARIEGHSPLTLPGDRLELALRAGPPTDLEEIRCYFADRDVGAELPAALLDLNLTPLPDDLAADLATVFGAIPMARIATASLPITTQ